MKIMKIIFVVIILLVLISGIIFIFLDSEKKTEKINNRELSDSESVQCALQLYQQKKAEGMNFFSQCLGTCWNYAVDIVHIPRSNEDNFEQNQCRDSREGKVSRFIELDLNGNIVRIV